MALINKIREKSGIAVGFLAVALILFIVGGDIFSGNSMAGGLFNGNKNKVGSINGVDVDYQQFNSLVDAQRQQMEMSTGRAVTDTDLKNLRNQVWEQLIQEDAFQPEYDKLGIDVSPDELREMIQGAKNLHPYIKQQFTNPNTGVFNEAQHRQFINAAANKELPVEQMAIWENFKSNLVQVRKAEKYQNLVAAADYITSAEAKREYRAQANKASADFLFVPFYSMSDSLVTVTDSDIKAYYSEHKEEFTPYDSRSFDYVVFNALPSKEDSAALQQELVDLAKGLANTTDAQAYAANHSDVSNPYLWSPGELSDEARALVDNSVVGATVGPVKEGQDYTIYKNEGTEKDSLYTLRASHILIRPVTDDDAGKQEAKERAQDILNQIKNGADFAAMARINGSDGTSQTGGDLGYFSNNGQMIPEFEKAVFAFNGTGLMPNLVETEFGFHIIKVTEAKNNLKYKLAAITKTLQPSEFTLNEVYQKAEDLRTSASTADELQKKVDEDDDLVLLNTLVRPGASGFGTVQDAKEVVLWAFGDEANVGEVASQVFVINNSYIVAALTGSTDKEDPKANDFKDQIEAKVRNDKKGKKILEKLAGSSGDLETVAQGYGAGALVENVEDISFQTGLLSSAGIDGIAIGKLFGLKAGETSKPFIGQNGVFILKKVNEVEAPEIADHAQYKESIKQRMGPYASNSAADQAVREAANIVDRRAKMF